jgi:hypothetical protein
MPDKSPSPFSEASSQDWSAEREALLRKRIKDLGLKIEGTYLESLVKKLYQELGAAGLQFQPRVYLSNEWSCPDGVPVIGIPFYLADPRLARLEDEIMEGIEAETEEEILSYLRHEAGHAFNYAYKLHEREDWRDLFGPFSRPYLEDYTPQPFSRNFVKHIPGWYAQKHPDEDFSETFAVWLTPGSNWREVYKDWGCFKKLLYVDRLAGEIGKQPPLVTGENYDFASEEMAYSVAEHYQQTAPGLVEVPAHFDGDLRDIFETRVPRGREGQWEAADRFLARNRRHIVDYLTYWTGLYDVIVRSLMKHLIERAKVLGLWVNPDKSQRVLMDVLVFMTTLCMNKLYKGDFVIR